MSTTLDVSLKVLYVQGLAVDVDRAATEQLRKASAELQITTIAGSAAALAELRRTPGWQALFASPSLPQNEVLALIASLRRDRIPIAIVPILDDIHQDLFASAVATGADDVLVRRNGTLVNVNETLTRIRQSPHLFPAEQRRRISVLYAGRDPLVWNLLDQVPFVKADRVATGIDGTCSVRRPGSGDDSMRADAVIIDEAPGEAHPLQVLKSVKAQASDLPVIMLTSAGAADIATAALELGADDTVLKTGIFRRRLIATLRRVHQRLELSAQQQETRTREERLRQIVENVPTGIMVVSGDGRVLAMNAAALQLFHASKPREIVGRDFRDLVGEGDRDGLSELIRQVTKGDAAGRTFEALTLGGERVQARIDAVMLERDARGGRGVVASITRAGAPATEAGADGRAAAELATLRDGLQTLERHYAELEDARAQERAAWESERQKLESRLEEAERQAAERQALQERLDEVTAELARTSQSFVAERQALERRLEQLEDAARDAAAAGASRAGLEAALEAVREEQRQAIAAHALERSGWQEIRAELEARVQQLDHLHQSEHDTLVASLRLDVQRLEQTLADERARWETTQGQLETELRNAREALWTEHTERDAARATFEAELGALRAAAEAERREWSDARTAFEGNLEAARTAISAVEADRDRLRQELDEQVRSLEATLDTERGDWTGARQAVEGELEAARAAVRAVEADRDHLRQELETRARSLEATLDAERSEWLASRHALEDARRQAEAALAHERAEWTEQRGALEDERRHLLEQGGQAEHLAEERRRLFEELDRTRQQWAAERDALERDLALARERAERSEEAALALTDEYDATRARLERDRDDVRDELAQTRTAMADRLAALDADLADARSRADAASAERDDLRRQLTMEQSALEQARAAERDEWQRRLADLEAALAAASAAADQHEVAWQQERRALAQAASEARTWADQERGQLVSLHARETEEWRQAVDQARSERDQAVARLSSFEDDLDAARRQLVELDEVRAALEIARADQTRANERIRALEGDLGGSREQLTELDRLRAEHAVVAAERDQARQRAAELETALEQVQQRVAALEADLESAHRQIGDLEPLRAALDTARGDLDQAHQRVAALEADLEHARRQVGDLEPLRAALDTARGECDQALQWVASLEGELDEARRRVGELEPLRALLEGLRGEHDQARQRLVQLDKDLAEARAAADQHQGLVDALEAARNELRHTDAARHAERDEWHRTREAIERDLRDLEARHHRERSEWEHLRAQLEAEAGEAARLAREHQFLHGTISALQSECASLSGSLAHERADHDHHRHELDALRSALADSQAQLAELDAALDRAARSADEQLEQVAGRHEARERALEADLQALTDRLRITTAEADATRDRLSADAARAAEARTRLVASGTFGYALTAMTGELVSCNDAFARMFGYSDAADALARTGGRPFPGLADRPAIAARLAADGHFERVASCVERIDGRAIRIVESATVLRDEPRVLVEHLVVTGPAGPTPEELHHRRLEEVGRLTTAMMPELEPLASTVHAHSEALVRQAEARKTLAAEAGELHAASERVASLVRQLAGFSRRQRREPEAIDLGQVVMDAEPMLTRLVGDYIAFTTRLGPTTPVIAQPDDVQQLLTSLVTLGRDLLPTGGSIVVEVRQADGSDGPTTGLGVPGPALAVRASGYGAQAPGGVPSLELVASRCGGTVHISSDDGRFVRLDVLFPRCGMPIT